MTKVFICVTGVLLCSLAAVVPARAQQPAAPASAPTTQAPPHKVTPPPGFKTVTVNGRRVLCEEADSGWVSTALAKISPTTKPATLPASLLEKLTSQRDTILRQMAVDMALSDLTQAAKMYDFDLVGTVRTLDQYRPPIFYLVASPDRLAELMRSGWSDPHFYYNRAADSVTFNPAGLLTVDRPQDEALFPAAYDPKDPPEKREQALTVTIGSIEASVKASIEIRARNHVGTTFALIAQEVGFAPLKLKDDQNWFTLGGCTYLAAKYTAQITGEPLAQLLDALSLDLQGNPLKGPSIDLVHPQDVKVMRQQAIPAYFDAFRRKSTRVVRALVEKGGDQAIPKTILAIRARKPADGPALIQLIKEATGVDVAGMAGKGQ
jgi:hypothetical protein